MAAYYLRWLAGLPFIFASPELARSWRKRNFGGWARASARILGLKINVRNAPPASPFLLVSNHLSYVDIIVLESQVDCAFIAKSEVASWPILGFICRTLNTIFIDRKRKRDLLRAIAKTEATLDRGLGVVLFAEGTSTNGHTILPFRPSLLEFAARRKIPVHYVSLSYTVPPDEAPAEQSVCWWGDMTFWGHLFRLLQLPQFEANVIFGQQPILAEDRHELAAELWSAVSAQFRAVTAGIQR
jgi:1-acyl-sn-glycerol-3-phosphate acyltransferase